MTQPHEHAAVKLVDDFEVTLLQIKSKGETFSDHALCLFRAFTTSHDSIFNNYIQTFKDQWDDGEGITGIVDKACTKLHMRQEFGRV